MSVFTVDLANQPGELARLCEAMAGRGINLVLSAIAREVGGSVAFIADDEAGAREVLDGAGLQYAMRPALTIRMENQPGAGAATFRKLANAGVNAGLLLPVRVSDALFFAVICVDDQDKARQALGAQVIPPGSRPVALAGVPGPGRSPPLPRSQRHRSYPGTRRPDRLSSRPPGSRQCLTTETDRRTAATAKSQSARRIRSFPPCRFGTAIWHADNEYRLMQIGLICAHAGMTFATTRAQCGHLVTRACDRGGGEQEMQPVRSRTVARVIVSHGVGWLIRRGGPHGRLSALRRRPARRGGRPAA